jgi:protein-disulfide isomerase
MQRSGRAAFIVAAISALSIAPGPVSSTAAQTIEEGPIAIVGGEPIYEKDYLPSFEDELSKIRQQEYQVRRQALEDAINKKLLHAEAQKRGVEDSDLLNQLVDSRVPPPTTEDIETEMARRMFGGGGRLNRDLVIEQLTRERVLGARKEFFQILQMQAGVRIRLFPPRVNLTVDPARIRGNPAAPVTIVEFADFHCPFCLKMYPTIKALLKKYDGQVRLAFRDLPLEELPDEIIDSPEAARCAGDQGHFWEYHDLLFENPDSFGEQVFNRYAEDLHLDMTEFDVCLASRKYKASIRSDFDDALKHGATGTPYFFIDGIPLNGAHPQADFEDIIELELRSKEDAAKRNAAP